MITQQDVRNAQKCFEFDIDAQSPLVWRMVLILKVFDRQDVYDGSTASAIECFKLTDLLLAD